VNSAIGNLLLLILLHFPGCIQIGFDFDDLGAKHLRHQESMDAVSPQGSPDLSTPVRKRIAKSRINLLGFPKPIHLSLFELFPIESHGFVSGNATICFVKPPFTAFLSDMSTPPFAAVLKKAKDLSYFSSYFLIHQICLSHDSKMACNH